MSRKPEVEFSKEYRELAAATYPGMTAEELRYEAHLEWVAVCWGSVAVYQNREVPAGRTSTAPLRLLVGG